MEVTDPFGNKIRFCELSNLRWVLQTTEQKKRPKGRFFKTQS